MSDNRFTYQHMTPMALRALISSDDEASRVANEPIPEPDIDIPAGLVPPLHAEEDESVLPSSSHSSYPYGNPYTLSLLPLRPSARTSKKGLRGNPHTRHVHTWTDLALEDLLPWEGEEPDLNYFAGLEAEAAAAAHAAATAQQAGEGDAEMQQNEGAAQAQAQGEADAAGNATQEGGAEQQAAATEAEGENSDQASERTDGSD